MHSYFNESPQQVFAALLLISFGIAAFFVTVFAVVKVTSTVFGRDDEERERG